MRRAICRSAGRAPVTAAVRIDHYHLLHQIVVLQVRIPAIDFLVVQRQKASSPRVSQRAMRSICAVQIWHWPS